MSNQPQQLEFWNKNEKKLLKKYLTYNFRNVFRPQTLLSPETLLLSAIQERALQRASDENSLRQVPHHCYLDS
jgi:hypothetical protein